MSFFSIRAMRERRMVRCAVLLLLHTLFTSKDFKGISRLCLPRVLRRRCHKDWEGYRMWMEEAGQCGFLVLVREEYGELSVLCVYRSSTSSQQQEVSFITHIHHFSSQPNLKIVKIWFSTSRREGRPS